jgi:LysM domain
MKLLKLLPTLLMLFSAASYAAEPLVYVVRTGDTLSTIAQKQIGSPIFRKGDGSLFKLLKMNPTVKDADLIFVGQLLFISTSEDRILSVLKPKKVSEGSEAAPTEISRTLASGEVAQPTTEAAKNNLPQTSTIESNPKSQIKFQTGFEFFRIDSKDSSTGGASVLLSNMNPVFDLSWELNWNKDWSSVLSLNAQSFKVLDDQSSASRTIVDASGTKFGFEVGAMKNWTSSARSLFAFTYGEKLFTHSVTTNDVTIDRVGISALKLSYEQDVFRIKNARLGIGGDASYLFPGSGPGYHTNDGYAAGFYSYLNHDLKNVSLSGRLQYAIERQNSTLTNQSRSNVVSIFFGADDRGMRSRL